MAETGDPSKVNNSLSLPVKIEYSILQSLLRKKMIGETISSEEKDGKVSNYAEILNVSLDRSVKENYDLAVEIKFRNLTSFLKNREGKFVLYAALDFDELLQQIQVVDFEIDGTSKNWLFNNTIETIANTFMRGKIRNKMKIDFQPEIQKQLLEINEKLKSNFEVADGIFLSGEMKFIKINEIILQGQQILVLVQVEGQTLINIQNIQM